MTIGPGGTDFGRDPADRDAGGPQPGGSWENIGGIQPAGLNIPNQPTVPPGLFAQLGTFLQEFAKGAKSRTMPQYTLGAGGVQFPGLYSYNQVEEFLDHGTINGQKPPGIAPQAKRTSRKLTYAQMTPAQRKVVGHYINAQGKRVTPKQLVGNAINRLVRGQPLTHNQNISLGLTLLSMSNSQRSAFSSKLALARFPGQNVNVTKAYFNKPLGQAMAAARMAKQNARR